MMESRLRLSGELQRQTRLTRAADTHERDDPHRFDGLADTSQLRFAPDELGHLRWQVPRQVQTRTQRRKARRSAHLPDVLRPTQIAQTMLAEIEQVDLANAFRQQSGSEF